MSETPSAEKGLLVPSHWNPHWNYHLGGEPRSICACPDGPYYGAQPVGTPPYCERCGGLIHVTPPAEHRLVGTGCTCGKWKAGLGESISRGFDLHLLDRRCAWCGEQIPTTKRVDAETCSDRCAKDRQRARVTSPGGGR